MSSPDFVVISSSFSNVGVCISPYPKLSKTLRITASTYLLFAISSGRKSLVPLGLVNCIFYLAF